MEINDIEHVVDNNNNIIMSCGLIEATPDFDELNSWVEGFYSSITSIEDEIRKYCIIYNIEIISLYSRKSSWLRKTLFIHLKGNGYKIRDIKNFINSL